MVHSHTSDAWAPLVAMSPFTRVNVMAARGLARDYALVLGIYPYRACLFPPGEVGECTKHWQVSPRDKEPRLLSHIETAV